MSKLRDAVEGMRSIEASYLWSDVGPRFTCWEANALVELFEALNLDEHAKHLRLGHADGDLEEDLHYGQGEQDST